MPREARRERDPGDLGGCCNELLLFRWPFVSSLRPCGLCCRACKGIVLLLLTTLPGPCTPSGCPSLVNIVPRLVGNGGASSSRVGGRPSRSVLTDALLYRCLCTLSSLGLFVAFCAKELVGRGPLCACSFWLLMGLKKPCAARDGTCVLLTADVGLDSLSEFASPLFRRPPLLLAANAASPRRELGGDSADRRPPLCDPSALVLMLVGREGGSPGSPTGPVEEGMLLCLSRADAKSLWSPSSDVASVAEDVGRPSAVEGNGSSCNHVASVGKGEEPLSGRVSDASFEAMATVGCRKAVCQLFAS